MIKNVLKRVNRVSRRRVGAFFSLPQFISIASLPYNGDLKNVCTYICNNENEIRNCISCLVPIVRLTPFVETIVYARRR